MIEKNYINLLDHPDYVVTPGVRGNIVWHGQTYNTKQLLPEVADRMAREAETKYINFSDARLSRETEARVAALLANAPVAADATAAAPAAKETAPASTEASSATSEEGSTASNGGSHRRRRQAAGGEE